MKPGDIIKVILHPFVKNTKYEDCERCEKRRLMVNNFWTSMELKFRAIFK